MTKQYKWFDVEFTNKTNKYSPTDRKIQVYAMDEGHARILTTMEHDSFVMQDMGLGKIKVPVPSEKHITITKVTESVIEKEDLK